MSREAYVAAARRDVAGMTLEDAIRYCCRDRMSKTQACEVLHISAPDLAIATQGMERLHWPPHGRSNLHQESQDRQRGVCTPAQAASLARARQQRLADQIHTVRGKTGTVPELYQQFDCPCSLRQVQRRIAEGLSVEQALFTPTARSNQHRKTHHQA